jgi:hypothetical protein
MEDTVFQSLEVRVPCAVLTLNGAREAARDKKVQALMRTTILKNSLLQLHLRLLAEILKGITAPEKGCRSINLNLGWKLAWRRELLWKRYNRC